MASSASSLFVLLTLIAIVTAQVSPENEAHVTVANLTPLNITKVLVTNLNDADWYLEWRPDVTFNNTVVRSGASQERIHMVQQNDSPAPFTMTLVYQDGGQDQFTINQKWVLDWPEAGFLHSIITNNVTYERFGNVLILKTIPF